MRKLKDIIHVREIVETDTPYGTEKNMICFTLKGIPMKVVVEIADGRLAGSSFVEVDNKRR